MLTNFWKCGEMYLFYCCRDQRLNTTAIIINEIESEESSNEGLKNYYDFKSRDKETASADEKKLDKK